MTVSDAPALNAALANPAVKKIIFSANITANINLSRLVDLDLGGNTLTGSASYDTSENGTLNLVNGTVTQNLTVTAANATVHNSLSVGGQIVINNVSGNTWNENANDNKILFNDPDEDTKLIIGANATVASITLNKPAVVTISNGATVTAMNVDADATGTQITNNGTVTNLQADGAVEVKGNTPVNVTGTPGNVTSAVNVGDQAELENALNNPLVTNIVLTKDIETTTQLLVKEPGQKIDGNGFAISAAANMQYQDPNKSVLTVLNANDATISNLTVDASKVNTPDKWDGVYAVQVYQSTGVTLDGLILQNADGGLLVNGSQVTVNNIETNGNEFGGIEVSQGKDVSSPAELTVTGTSKHDEEVHIWTVGENATVDSNLYKSAKDGRTGKEAFTNFILTTENREVPHKLLEAPTNGMKELVVTDLKAEDVKYLAFNLTNEAGSAQKIATLDEVVGFIADKYDGATLNTNALKVEDGKISITGSLLSRSDWDKVKANGDVTSPYRITVLNKDKTAKIAKIAMYQDGEAVIESLLPADK